MAQFHTHGTPPPAKQRSSPRRPVTPAIAALIAGALISASAWAAPPDAQFSASAGGASPIRIPGEVSGVIIGDFPDSGGTDSASTTTDLTAHAKGAASSKGTAGGGGDHQLLWGGRRSLGLADPALHCGILVHPIRRRGRSGA